MADNVRLDDNTTSGALVRTVEKNSKQVPVSLIDVGGSSEALVGSAGVYMPIEGGAADGASANIGNPIVVGAKYEVTPTALSNGQVGHLGSDSNRNLKTVIYDASGNNRGLNVDADGAIAVTFSNSSLNYDTTNGETQNASCFGVVVPSESGPAAVTGTASGSVTALDVNVLNSSAVGGGTQYSTSDTGLSALTGTVALGIDTDNSGKVRALDVSTSGLKVDVGTPSVTISGTPNVNVGSPSVSISSGTVTTVGTVTSITNAVDIGTMPSVSLSSSGNTVQISNSANTVKIDSQNNGVSLGTNNPVSLQIAGNDLTATSNNLNVHVANEPTIGISGTNNAVSLGTNNPVSLQTSGTNLTSTTVSTSQALDVNVANDISIGSGEVYVARSNLGSPTSSTAIKVDTGGRVQVDNFLVNGNTINTQAGPVAAGTQRVVLADRGLSISSVRNYSSGVVSVKSTSGTVFSISAFNMTASPLFIKVYDITNGATLGSSTPKMVFPIPSNSAQSGAGFVLSLTQGIEFTNRIEYGVTTGLADSDTNLPQAGDVIINIAYA